MGLTMDRAQRLFVGAVLPVWFLGLIWVPWLVVRSSLPDPIAVHFGLDDSANGRASVGVYLLVMTVFVLAASWVLVRAAWRPESGHGVSAACATFVGWLVSSISAALLFANEGHDSWREVTMGTGAAIGASLSALGASLPVALMVRNRLAAVGGSPGAAPVQLSGTERVAWFGHARSAVLAVTAVLTLAFGAALLLIIPGAPIAWVVALGAGLTVAMFTSVEVSVSSRGVRIRPGTLHRPVVWLPLEEITAARLVDLDPMAWGGWGSRGSLRITGRAAWVLRGGPGLELDLVGDRRFAVSVDGADEAAQVVNGLLDRASPRPR